jgi:hypothetical protein
MTLPSTISVIFAANWVEIAIGGIVFFFYIAGQLMNLRGDAKAKPKRPRRQPAPDLELDEPEILLRDDKNAPQPGRAADQAESLRNEIEDFVRRAQGKSPQPNPTVRKRQPARQRPPVRQGEQRASGQHSSLREMPPPSLRSEGVALRSEGVALRSEGVAEHVSRHIGSSEVAEHAKHIESNLDQIDGQVDLRVHEEFDHPIDSLKHRETSAEQKKPREDFAAEIVAMLSRPEGIRQLIIANEILRRPQW